MQIINEKIAETIVVLMRVTEDNIKAAMVYVTIRPV